MIAYLVMNMREGDMVSLVSAHGNRQNAEQRLLAAMLNDSSTAWWKIIEIDVPQIGVEYDFVVRVSWGSSNRVRFIGAFQVGTVPQRYDGDRYFTENLICN